MPARCSGPAEIRGELLLVWGKLDPHIPEEGRSRIAERLREAGVVFSERIYEAEHAFMRDEGPDTIRKRQTRPSAK